MKYKFLTLLVLLVLFSCKKPTNYCWQCEVQKYKDYIYDGVPTQDTQLTFVLEKILKIKQPQ